MKRIASFDRNDNSPLTKKNKPNESCESDTIRILKQIDKLKTKEEEHFVSRTLMPCFNGSENQTSIIIDSEDMVSLVCSFLFGKISEDSKSYAFSSEFAKATCEVMDTNVLKDGDCELYIIEDYDYENMMKDDYRLKQFCSFVDLCAQSITDFIDHSNMGYLKKSVTDFFELWMQKEETKNICIMYDKYFMNFVCLFNDLCMLNDPIVNELHLKCVGEVLKTISECDEIDSCFKYSVFEVYKSRQKKSKGKGKALIDIDNQDENDYEDNIDDEIKSMSDDQIKKIAERVEKWDGKYPFCCFINDKCNVETFFNMMKDENEE